MFAGAVRETVLSNPLVIRRLQSDFIPVAVRTTNVLRPGDDEEGDLFRNIAHLQVAPQGMGVLNAAGQLLSWTETYDDAGAVLRYLDDGVARYHQHVLGSKAVATARWWQFPSGRRPDGEQAATPLPAGHDGPCPYAYQFPIGSLKVRLVGRALNAAGKPLTDTLHQEHYVEDAFMLPSTLGQNSLPTQVARILATHAHLGHLDVQPLNNPLGGIPSVERLDLRLEPDAAHPGRLLLSGTSDVASAKASRYSHRVSLRWHGTIEVRDKHMRRLTLLAEGTEHLVWQAPTSKGCLERCLPTGHAMEYNGPVRFGFIGEAVSATAAAPPQHAPH